MKVRLEVSESQGEWSLLVPGDIAAAMHLKHGDEIEVDLHRNPIELSPALRRQHLASLRKYRGKMPAGHDANAR
jgi:antitoxin component of MazEF toxin-antitoxin module